jgi:hypothetical protein
VPPGSYIGQLITPRPGQVAAEARLPCFIGRGSRLALGSNLPITRSYVFGQTLTFSSIAPFVAGLTYASDGDQQSARLYKADGTEVRNDQWAFQDSGSPGGQLDQVLVNTEVFDPTATYSLDYQSTSRDITDVVPVEELREIVSIGTRVDSPQYIEYEHFFITTDVTGPVADSGNTNPDSTLSPLVADVGNTGAGVVAFASSAEFAHDYTRQYDFEVTAQNGGVQATGTITIPAGGGGALIDGETLTLDDGVNTPTVFEYDSAGGVTGSNVAITFTGGDTATQVRDATVAAINGVGATLLITAAPSGGDAIDLTADNFGTLAGTVTETVADAGYVVTGMVGGTARDITVEWSATAVSPGNAALPNTPLHSSATKPTFTVTDDNVASFTPLLELGVRLDFDFGALADNQFDVGDSWRFFGNGPGLFEEDVRYGNTNQFATINDPVADAGNTGTAGSGLDIAATAAFTGTWNATYTLEVTAIVGAAPGTRTATFVWGEAGDHVGINGTFLADEAAPATLTQTLSKGVDIDVVFPVGAGNFVAGDKFTIAALAARQLYQSKDNRTYTMTVSAATNPSVGVGYVQGSYVTDTPEGSFGTFEATGNDLAVTNPLAESAHFQLPNNILLAARNLFWPSAEGAVGNQHVAADVHTFAATQAGTIDWRLNEQATETIEADQILTDVNGTVTGTPNTRYVILSQVPLAVNSVVTVVGSTPVTYTAIAGTPYVTFPTDPGEAIVVSYDWRSAEPDPGQTYFLTAKFLRPTELYNTPTLVLDRQDGRALLAPASVENHLYAMNEIAWDNGVPGVYFIQVQDPDDDGVFTDADFAEAIIASEAPRRITDVVVLSQFSSLGAALASVTRMNDPFERRERLCWVGAPIGTPIGDAQTPGTLVYTARNTLQVFGLSPAHGTRIMVGSTQATRDLRLDDGSTVEITMDGSFIAGALASLVASFQDPGTTILRLNLAGFKTMETYGDVEDPRNLTLGAAQIVYVTDRGGGVFRIEEDETTDSFADDTKAINAMTQKHYVVKNVRTQVDNSLVGVVVPSAQAGVGIIKGFVVGAVASLVSRGVVGRFQDANGTERSIDPDADVVVFRDDTDPTLYHFFFAFWLKTTIKRLFGLYSVNSNDFGLFRG